MECEPRTSFPQEQPISDQHNKIHTWDNEEPILIELHGIAGKPVRTYGHGTLFYQAFNGPTGSYVFVPLDPNLQAFVGNTLEEARQHAEAAP